MRRFWQRDISQAPWNLRRDGAMRRALAALGVALICQGAFWWHSRAIMPEMSIVPAVPGERTVQALSFGDEEAFFRLLALNIQSSGDTFGRFTALYKYDFNKLYHWFHLLNGLDNQSSYLPAMASYYFSQTQKQADVAYLVDFLEEYTEGRVKEKWWWVTQASYLAGHKLHDQARAIRIAERLRGVKGIPIWAQQLAAFEYEKNGEFGEALRIIEEILADPSQYSQGELNFMKYFISERLGKLDEVRAQFEQIEALKAKERAEGKPDGGIRNSPPPDVGAPRVPLQ